VLPMHETLRPLWVIIVEIRIGSVAAVTALSGLVGRTRIDGCYILDSCKRTSVESEGQAGV
jgi:hypothetical protein